MRNATQIATAPPSTASSGLIQRAFSRLSGSTSSALSNPASTILREAVSGSKLKSLAR